MNIKSILINKNRGWRGLTEIRCYDDNGDMTQSTIFSFSQPVWDDLQKGYIVIQDQDNYYILQIDDTDRLPKGQRSVLIKNFMSKVVNIYTYNKDCWQTSDTVYSHRVCIYNFLTNKNNHTTSDWNCIGIRVVPMI